MSNESMNPNNLPFNWFDVLVVLVIFLGIARGRKRGLSQEVFTMTLWLVLIFACAFAYRPMGDAVASATPFSQLFCYLASYLLLAAAVALAFMPAKRAFGGKIISADTFGSAEYYVGMPAGLVRAVCILIAALALLNARFYSSQEITAMEKYQQDVYGSEFFPGLSSLQRDVFARSFTGPYIQKYLKFFLIKPTPPQHKELKRAKENW